MGYQFGGHVVIAAFFLIIIEDISGSPHSRSIGPEELTINFEQRLILLGFP